jgi:hypothetical protein
MSEINTETVERKNKWLDFDFGLPTALGVIIAAALVIVTAGYMMYLSDSNQKYDIARPGNAEENEALNVIDPDSDITTPVDAPAAKRKIDFLSKELNALSGINKFNPEDLSDQNLQLLPGEPSL